MATTGNLEICMAQKANMEAIFNSVGDGILTLDPALMVTNINTAARETLGVTLDWATGRHVSEVLHGRLWKVSRIVQETLRTGEHVQERENLLLRPDGGELRVLLSASRLLDRTGDTGGAVLIVRDMTHVRELEVRLQNRTSLHGIIGSGEIMQEIFTLIEQVAPTDSTILILGESGTGKELFADAIHRASARQNAPFVKVNCSALSESLLESELFGHVKGAYTGALHDRKGRFEMASGGTIFLDEIGDLSERIQVKLLRVLQEREIERVGDTRTVKIDVRVLAATHQPLKKLVDDGRFRQDLYYRLNVIPIDVPPLRDRRESIPDLAAAFVEEFAERMRKTVYRISPDAMRALMDHRWPGNVRELRNAIEHAVVKNRGKMLLLEDLPRELIEETADVSALVGRRRRSVRPNHVLKRPSGDEEKSAILSALEETGWNKGRAAERLGIERTTLWRKMKRHGITSPTG